MNGRKEEVRSPSLQLLDNNYKLIFFNNQCIYFINIKWGRGMMIMSFRSWYSCNHLFCICQTSPTGFGGTDIWWSGQWSMVMYVFFFTCKFIIFTPRCSLHTASPLSTSGLLSAFFPKVTHGLSRYVSTNLKLEKQPHYMCEWRKLPRSKLGANLDRLWPRLSLRWQY